MDADQAARVDRHHPCVDRHRDPSETDVSPKLQKAAECVHKPVVPCPMAVEAYNALVEVIGWQVPGVLEFRDLPSVKKILDKAYKDEIGLDEATNLIHDECAAILLSRIPKKLEDPGNTQAPPSLRQLPMLEDPGRFVVPCYISGIDFEDSLCDSGSTVNLMSKDIAESLGFTNTQPSRMSIRFANAQVTTPHGCIKKLPVRVGNCLVPTDFQVVEMSDNSYMPLILGRSFLATAGALVDLPNKRVSLSNIDKDVFYDALPDNHNRFSSYISTEEKKLAVVKTAAPVKKVEVTVNAVLNRDTKSSEKKSPLVSKRDKPKSEIQLSSSKVTLTPLRRVGDTIEYKLKCKGKSRPFSKVRAVITPEFKEKGQAFLDDMLSKVLELNLHDHRANRQRLNPPPPHPDPPMVSHHP